MTSAQHFLSLFEADTLGRAYRGAVSAHKNRQKMQGAAQQYIDALPMGRATYDAMKKAQQVAKSKGKTDVIHMISADRFLAKVGTDYRGNLSVPFEKAIEQILLGQAGEISVSVESAPWSMNNAVLLVGETSDLLEYYDYDAYTQPTEHGKIPQNFGNAGGAWDEGVVDSAKVKWHTAYVAPEVGDMFEDDDPEYWFEENYPRIDYCDDLDCIRGYVENGTARQQDEQDKNNTIRDWEYEMNPLFMSSRYTTSGYIPEEDMRPELLPFQKVFGELVYDIAAADEQGISIAHLYEPFKEFREKLAPVLQQLGQSLQASEHEAYL